jgi:predicted peroxiredoxin
MGHILINNTRGKDDVERATLAFVVANAGLTAGQQATVLLTVEGVWLATKGYADGLQAKGFAPLGEVMQGFMDNGGRMWVCGACAKPRDITPEQLIEGPEIVGAVAAVEALVSGAQSLSF